MTEKPDICEGCAFTEKETCSVACKNLNDLAYRLKQMYTEQPKVVRRILWDNSKEIPKKGKCHPDIEEISKNILKSTAQKIA